MSGTGVKFDVFGVLGHVGRLDDPEALTELRIVIEGGETLTADHEGLCRQRHAVAESTCDVAVGAARRIGES